MNDLLLAGWTGELLTGFDPGQRFALVVVALGCGTGVVLGLAGIIMSAFNSVHRRRLEMEMKRDLVERGMTAEEIVQVIECAPPLEDATQRWIASWCNSKKAG